MKIPPQSTLSGFFDKKIQEFDEWIVEVFEPFFEFWPSVRRPLKQQLTQGHGTIKLQVSERRGASSGL